MAEIVYLNGALVARPEAKVSVFDYGFLYGCGLFETMRAYRGTIFLLERHVERLVKSAGIIGLADGLAGIDLAAACRQTLAANGLQDARLRLTVTRGEAGAFPGLGDQAAPTVLVTASPYAGLPAAAYQRGFRALVASPRQSRRSPLPGAKSTSYLLYLMARLEAAAAGWDEALLLNDRGSLAEGSTSNIFLVDSDGSLVTPPLSGGLLPGITRAVVMELAKANGIAVKEAEVKPAELGEVAEAFLTNSVMEIMPLVEVRDGGKTVTIGSGGPGPVTRRLMAAYGEAVEAATRSR